MGINLKILMFDLQGLQKHLQSVWRIYLESKEAEVCVMKRPTRSVELLWTKKKKIKKKERQRETCSVSATISTDGNIPHFYT